MDDIRIIIENAQQFWSELEDALDIPTDGTATLSHLDNTLKRFLGLCSAYHEQYLQTPLQIEHACDLVLDSELFTFHSERMCEILLDDAQSTTDPHLQLIIYNTLLCHGRRQAEFFRSQKRWQPLMPLLMDHILVEIDSDAEDTYFGIVGSSSQGGPPPPIPIEAKLRSLGVRMMYEVCRVQKLASHDLRIFDDAFIDYLFDLVEQTRNMQDESFNYSVIKLIVSLNEQFMVAALAPGHTSPTTKPAAVPNRVLQVLTRRRGASKTFGENMIFMLNRAKRTAEDMCMQLLVLKILYLLFTTKDTSEHFYTNDLCVLVDVFLRELADLDEDSESLRHTYLRVLHPLLTKTQLRQTPYKRPQIVHALETMIQPTLIREVTPTTRRLVERCLSGDWCVQFKKASPTMVDVVLNVQARERSESQPHLPPSSASSVAGGSISLRPPPGPSLKTSRSVENLRDAKLHQRAAPGAPHQGRRGSNDSSMSLSNITSAVTPTHGPSGGGHHHHSRKDSRSLSATADSSFAAQQGRTYAHSDDGYGGGRASATMSLGAAVDGLSISSSASLPTKARRTAPPPPAASRRKPPAPPGGTVNATLGGGTITTIKVSSPLAPVRPPGFSGLQPMKPVKLQSKP